MTLYETWNELNIIRDDEWYARAGAWAKILSPYCIYCITSIFADLELEPKDLPLLSDEEIISLPNIGAKRLGIIRKATSGSRWRKRRPQRRWERNFAKELVELIELSKSHGRQ